MLDNEILQELIEIGKSSEANVKEFIYSGRKELSHLSLRVRRKLAELSIKYEQNLEVDEETGMFRMLPLKEKSDALKKFLPTCFKQYAEVLY